MIEISEKTVGVWFVQCSERIDWMAHIAEVKPEEEYKLTYRFRHYKDDKVFESQDEKHWFSGDLHGTKAFVIAALNKVSESLYEVERLMRWYGLNEGNIQEFTKKLSDAPFAHARRVSREELAKYDVPPDAARGGGESR